MTESSGKAGLSPGDAAEAQADQAPHVLRDGLRQLDAGVGVLHPPYGDVLHPVATLFGQDQQLRVKEPLLVLDARHQLLRRLAAKGLEPTLGIGEPSAKEELDEEVVTAGGQLSLEGTSGLRPPGEAAPHRYVVPLIGDGADEG